MRKVTVRRGLLAAVAIGAIILSAPGGAVADTTNCGVVVCATAAPQVDWTCTSEDFAGYDLITCGLDATAAASGRSDLSLPGSLGWSVAAGLEYTFDGGATWLSGDSNSEDGGCAWPGLGEDTCGGDVSFAVIGGFYVPDFTCITTPTSLFDYRGIATSAATASKSAPLGVATLDSATATETATARLSELSPTDLCAFP